MVGKFKEIIEITKESCKEAALEEARISLIDNIDNNKFLQFLFNMKEKRPILQKKRRYTFEFEAFLIHIKQNDVISEKDRKLYDILIDEHVYDELFFEGFKEKYEDVYSREYLVERYEQIKKEHRHHYYKHKMKTNVDEMIEYNTDLEFYRTIIRSRIRSNLEFHLPVILK